MKDLKSKQSDKSFNFLTFSGRVFPETGLDADHLHYHQHHHLHQVPDPLQRSLPSLPGPAYNIKSNPDFVEATFVFPNRNDTRPLKPSSLIGQSLGVPPLPLVEPLVIDAAARVNKPEIPIPSVRMKKEEAEVRLPEFGGRKSSLELSKNNLMNKITPPAAAAAPGNVLPKTVDPLRQNGNVLRRNDEGDGFTWV